MKLSRFLSIPLLTAILLGLPVVWAWPEELPLWRSLGIVLGWAGCGLLLACLFVELILLFSMHKCLNIDMRKMMQKPLKHTWLLILLFAGLVASAQDKSNRGKEFWLGYGYCWNFTSEPPLNTQELVLYSSADAPATVTVSISNTGWSQTVSIPANTVNASILIPKTGTDDARIFNEGLHNKAVHIVSDTPIVVYAHTYNGMISAATMLMPVETYGYKYYSLNYSQAQSGSSPPNPPITTTQNGPDRYSGFM